MTRLGSPPGRNTIHPGTSATSVDPPAPTTPATVITSHPFACRGVQAFTNDITTAGGMFIHTRFLVGAANPGG